MPCRDDWSDDQAAAADRRSTIAELNMVTALLCAVLTLVENEAHLTSFLSKIDWAEAGVSRKELERWWKEHKAEDGARRLAEEKERARNEAREAALAKLTPEERKLLGVR